jgi:hypothetical protein
MYAVHFPLLLFLQSLPISSLPLFGEEECTGVLWPGFISTTCFESSQTRTIPGLHLALASRVILPNPAPASVSGLLERLRAMVLLKQLGML